MDPIAVEPFGGAHVAGAARLLAARHDEHRRRIPLLPKIVDFEPLLNSALPGATGVAALEGGEVVGYLIGEPRDDAHGGAAIWSGVAGQAVADPGLVDELYARAAEGWVEAGYARHTVFVPAGSALVEAWFRLGFGASGVLAIRDLSPLAPSGDASGVRVRPSVPNDLPGIARLAAFLDDALRSSPSFGGGPPMTVAEREAEWSDLWTDETFTHFVAEVDGVLAGHALMYRRPPDLRVLADAIDLGSAATDPAFRRRGVGLALTAHVLDWARAEGFASMTTDWRMTNLLARRFWPGRGFREAFLRLHRSIP